MVQGDQENAGKGQAETGEFETGQFETGQAGSGDDTAAPMEKATFAAGCFWGVEEAFRDVPGVVDVEVGYTGGTTDNPSYEDVCSGRTGHAEAVLVTFDPGRTAFEDLLFVFWATHDPTTPNRQGFDIGSQYRSAIFTHSKEQERTARASLRAAQSSFSRPIVTEIVAAGPWWRAEEYHQRYIAKSRGLAQPVPRDT